MADIKMEAVENSNAITSRGYDPATQTLAITFQGSGKTFGYEDFPPEQWQAFRDAPSAGKFFHASIKNRYMSRQVA